jgi:hypothetical protein
MRAADREGDPTRGARLGHDPEKWEPVFGKDHAPTKRWIMMAIQPEAIRIQGMPLGSGAGSQEPGCRIRPNGATKKIQEDWYAARSECMNSYVIEITF